MGKKINIKKALLFLIIVFLIIMGFLACYILYNWGIFHGERDAKYISQYYQEPENSLDGIVIGSSAAYRYWCAPEAYERHGIAVYCYGIQSMPIFATKYYIESALKTQSPEFIAIELRTATKSPDIYQTGHVLTAVNRMPNSVERTKIIAEFMKFDLQHGTRITKNPSAYGLPEDNGRGKQSEAIIESSGRYKGYIPYIGAKPTQLKEPHYPIGKAKIDYHYEEDLKDLLDYCDDLDCKVMFFATPFNGENERIKKLNYAVGLVEESGYTVINMNNLDTIHEIGIDYSEDFFNATHTNAKGAVKVTDYLSDIFTDMYDLHSHKGEKKYESWDKAYQRFKEECL